MRHVGVIRIAAVRVLVAVLATVVVMGLPSAQAAPAHRCGNVRVDRKLEPSVNGEFGAFRIRARQTSCASARRLAAR
jgi:hypothetical protein